MQALIDTAVAGMTLFIALTFFGWILPLIPALKDPIPFGTGLCGNGSTCDAAWMNDFNGSSGASFWVSLLLACLCFLLASGALSRSRRSPGMLFATTWPVTRAALGTSQTPVPSRIAMLSRWLLVLGAFTAGTLIASGVLGVVFVFLIWLPCLFGSRLALHDLLTGTAVAEVGFEEAPVASDVQQGVE